MYRSRTAKLLGLATENNLSVNVAVGEKTNRGSNKKDTTKKDTFTGSNLPKINNKTLITSTSSIKIDTINRDVFTSNDLPLFGKNIENKICSISTKFSSYSMIDDSDKDKDYVPPGENNRNLEEFVIEIDVNSIDQQMNNDSITDVLHSNNDKDVVSLINYLCETVCRENTSTEKLLIQKETSLTPLPIIVTSSETEYSLNQYTKSGKQRKRKKFKHSVKDRKDNKKRKTAQKHKVLEPCNANTCKKKCVTNICYDRRCEINSQFWNMDADQRKQFILNVCNPTEIKRRSVLANSDRKCKTYVYHLTDENSKCFKVCKLFFLTTLGFKKNNDKVVYNILNKTPPGNIIPYLDKRNKREPHYKYQYDDKINEHIETFHPTISHYRREHAPNTRYLPSDINIAMMHQDFIEKYPNQKVSYEFYRCKLKEKNISFTNLGHEECEQCEQFKLHDHNKDSIQEDCELCIKWKTHETKYIDARNLYKKHSAQQYNVNCVTVSADLQKVIMLPRAEMFKKVIFTRRIIAYHQSFVPVGTNTHIKPLACIWHEGTTGRNKEDIISTFYTFLKKHRDVPTVQIWLDNCASQNKNWCLLTFLVYIVNSCDVSINTIIIYYFEPGHTYMSADSFHHQVELSLKKQKKTLDFNDFEEAVQNSNKGRVDLKVMDHTSFYDWKDYKSAQKLQKENRTLLKDIVCIKVEREKFKLQFKTKITDTEYKELDFLCKKNMKKNGIPNALPKAKPCGVPKEKIDSILHNLSQILPENRKTFWKNLQHL